ncbi:hypothetical protein COCMIDRAFT_41352 [Bipolaris oryzae ATCC 44560]|uniref:Uncharacterized protein n=1 Tax=Bipolaris oryzae ATCC 44560 TaxID=930090 RepID=W6YS27_COCMI|nr:uncharacterized protein COCMIDRAFT_41352 [Bipolaris oryzae ATCC 44560]EUC40308.1 hypothetical protein COCMIDRAFT_41352 [Bipolaris oryzae ATCC 44560]
MIIKYFSNNERRKILRNPRPPPLQPHRCFPPPKRLEEPKLSDTNDPNDYEPVYICSYEMKCDDDTMGSVMLFYPLAGSEIITCVCIYIRYALAMRQTISPLSDEPHEPFSTRSTPFVFFSLDCPFLLFQMAA